MALGGDAGLRVVWDAEVVGVCVFGCHVALLPRLAPDVSSGLRCGWRRASGGGRLAGGAHTEGRMDHRILGPLEVCRDGETLHFGGDNQRALPSGCGYGVVARSQAAAHVVEGCV